MNKRAVGRYITPGFTFQDDKKQKKKVVDNSQNGTTVADSIAKVESGGNYKAFNSAGGGEGAVGKYQFRWKLHKDKIRKFAGNPKLTAEEFMNNPSLQDRFFNEAWVPKYVMPDVKDIKSTFKTELSDKELIKLVHYRGGQGAKDYIQGKVKDKPEEYNMSISKYIGTDKKALGGTLSTYMSLAKPVGDLIEGDGTNPLTAGLSGALQGGVIPMVTKTLNAIKLQKQKQKEEAIDQNNVNKQNVMESRNAYSTIRPTSGVGFYALGGKPYEAEKGEVIVGDSEIEESTQLAEGVQKVEGKKHKDGGTQASGGEFIYSDVLLADDSIKQLLKPLKIKIKSDATYAEIATQLGKLKGKYDRKSVDFKISNTDKLMQAKIMSAMEVLAQSQEQLKKDKGLVEDEEEKALGGVPNQSIYMRGFTNPNNPMQVDKSKLYNFNYGLGDYAIPKSLGMKLSKTPDKLKNTGTKGLPVLKPRVKELNLKGVKPPTAGIKSKADNFGIISSTAGLLNDINTANKLKTGIRSEVIPTQRLAYTDLTRSATATNNAAFQSYLGARTGTPKNIQQAFGQTLAANNQIAAQESQRKDVTVNEYNNANMRVKAINAQQANRANEMENQLENYKTEAKGGAFSNYLGNLNTVKAEQNAIKLDEKAMDLVAKKMLIGGGLFDDVVKMFQNLGLSKEESVERAQKLQNG